MTADVPPTADVPAGFRALPRHHGFIGLFGPLYLRERDDGGTVIALRIDERHIHIRGIAPIQPKESFEG